VPGRRALAEDLGVLSPELRHRQPPQGGEAEIAKVQATIDRYFAAFETQTLKPEVCAQKVDDLNARIAELEVEKRDLEERRKHLEIPPIDPAMLLGLLDNLGKVMAVGTNPQKKDLLRRLVKKVLIHDRRTVEIWYALPNQTPVRTPAHPAPRAGRSSNRSLPSRLGIPHPGDVTSEARHGRSSPPLPPRPELHTPPGELPVRLRPGHPRRDPGLLPPGVLRRGPAADVR
jgi:hypothetical protein